jgi:hypothetical protein
MSGRSACGSHWFSFKGYIHAYPSENFTHVDTRGLTSKMTE